MMFFIHIYSLTLQSYLSTLHLAFLHFIFHSAQHRPAASQTMEII